MDPQFVQNLRYKLQKRVRRLRSTNSPNVFLIALKHFWKFYDSNPSYVGISDVLIAEFPDAEKTANQIVDESKGIAGDSEEHSAVLGYFVLRKLSQEDDPDRFPDRIINLPDFYGQIDSVADALELINNTFLEPFYEYVDEQLDEQRATLNLLLKYKHRCEWFHANKLHALASEKSRKAEKNLAVDLYSYLHDQGINFYIEPSSIHGEVDLIGAQGTSDPLVADAKIFDGDSRGKSYILRGFNQVYNYTLQYNESFGYLVVFKITDKNLGFALKTQSEIPLVRHNHKSIFILTIDIYPHPLPVSKRGNLRTVEITEEELITHLEEEKTETSPG